MITIYKNKKQPYELIQLNDVFFNQKTVDKLDKKAKKIVTDIDGATMIDNYTIKSKFDGSVLNIDKLSSGCKTVLNILYNPDKIFDIRECGENALDAIFSLANGNVFCEYPMISFNMKEVKIIDSNSEKIITDYDELKAWWQNEN